MGRLTKVYLTKEIPAEDIEICCFTAHSLKEAIDRGDQYIVTTQTSALGRWSDKLYDWDSKDDNIIIINGKEQLSMRDIMSGKYEDEYNMMHVRWAHNWEKLLFSGVFNIPGLFDPDI